MQAPVEPLWRNENPAASYMWEFLQLVNKKYNKSLASYDDLYAWSIDCLPQFWEEVWAFTGMQAVPHRSGGIEQQNGVHPDAKPFKRVSILDFGLPSYGFSPVLS